MSCIMADDLFSSAPPIKVEVDEVSEDMEQFSIIEVISAIQNVLDLQDLFYRQIDKWLLITRKGFDCFINEEPHHAIMFLLDLDTGQYMIRVWSKTLLTGYLADPDCISDKILETFKQCVPCTGVLQEEHENTESVLFNEFPFSRMISTKCSYITKVERDFVVENQFLCKPCQSAASQEPNGSAAAEDHDFNPSLKTENCDTMEDMMDLHEDNPEEMAVNEVPEDMNYSDSDSEYEEVKRTRNTNGRRLRHPCNYCSESYAKLADLFAHKRKSHLYGEYPCQGCSEKFDLCSEYLSHNLQHHPELGELKCPTCRVFVPTEEIDNHVR